MPDEPSDNPTQPTDEAPESTEQTLAERKAFKPSGETKSDGALNKKGKKAKKEKPEPTTFAGKLWYGWVKPIGSVIIVVIVFRSMLLDWNDVPSGSMEPEIHVGDRVAVNRLAYALQFPLTGPKIGIPFIGPQFDNPLDGIGQIEWGEPQRGDIVTFWNPSSKIRMIKRIVAVPGDTLEVRNSVMIINGQAASYADVDALAEKLPVVTKYKDERGNLKTPTLSYQRETLLDQVRVVQHIDDRWPSQWVVIELPDKSVQLSKDNVVVTYDGEGKATRMSLPDFLIENPGARVAFEVQNGQILMSGKEVSYNTLAKTLLREYETGPAADVLAKINLGVKGHDLLVDGKPAFNEEFGVAYKAGEGQLSTKDRAVLGPFLDAYRLMRDLLGTNFGPYTVPEDKYFMVGDNRNNSSDGRHFGPVDRGEITGQAFAIAFSFEDNKMFTLPPDPAWDRFFKDLD